MKHFFPHLKRIFFSVPKASFPTRYIALVREIKKSPVKLRLIFYFFCFYVWNLQRKITVSDILSYSSVEDPLGLAIPLKGEESTPSMEREAQKQVQLTIEALYRPNTWAQITTSMPFRLMLGGGIFCLSLKIIPNQNTKSLNLVSQINPKFLSSILVSSQKNNENGLSNLTFQIYGNDWLIINSNKQFFSEESTDFSVSKFTSQKSRYFKKISTLIHQSSKINYIDLKPIKKKSFNSIPVFLPIDLGFDTNKTNYHYRIFDFCNINLFSTDVSNIKKQFVKNKTQFLNNIKNEHELFHKSSFFFNERSDTPFLFFAGIDKILLYAILPYLLARVWLAPSFVLWWSYKFDTDKKKNIKKGVKKIEEMELIKISKFLGKAVTFRDVGGMDTLKKELKMVAFLLRQKDYSSPYPTGYIFAGPPGTGKTLMAKAMAYEAQSPYIYVEGYQFQNQQTEIAIARVKDLFSQIKQLSPCILYIDEIDSIGERRDNNPVVLEQQKTSGSENIETKAKPSDTLLMQFLLYMDGFKTKRDVIIIGATNRLEILDNALLRPGRFDRQIFFSPPLFKERVDILKIFLSVAKTKTSEQKNSIYSFKDQTSIDEIAQRSMGFNGCDLRLLADNYLFLNKYGLGEKKTFLNNKIFTNSQIFFRNTTLTNSSNSLTSSRNVENQNIEKNLLLDQAFEKISRIRYKISNYEKTLNKKDFSRSACHEIGKAIIHILLPESYPIYSIRLFPKPLNDRFLEIERKNIRVPSIDLIATNNADYFLQKIVALFAGRAAESVLFDANKNNISTYLNRSFDENLYIAYKTSRYMMELGLLDSKNGILQHSADSINLEDKKNLFFSHIHGFVKAKALLKGNRSLRKIAKFDLNQPFLTEFWYEQDYVWDFDFLQQTKRKEKEGMLDLDIQTVYHLHTLFQYSYDFFKSNIQLLDYLTFLLLKEKQLSYHKIVDILEQFDIKVPQKTWKPW